MTSELKCPFCGEKLYSSGDCYFCLNDDCVFCGFYFMKKRWKAIIELKQALLQAKQDLEIATKANDEIRGEYETYHGAERERCFIINWEAVAKKMYDYANKALEQIEHKE